MAQQPMGDDEYDPTSPTIIKKETTHAQTSAYDNPTSPSYRPQSPNEKEKDSFAFVGDPFQPTNLVDIVRPTITKWLRCNICPDPIHLHTFVPAFLCRRPNEAPIPSDFKGGDENPWFWTQAYCFGCRYTFTVKIYLPRELFSCCTLTRYPPPKSRDNKNRHNNGLPPSHMTAVDTSANEMVSQRKREVKRRKSPLRPPQRRSPPRSSRRYSRSRSPPPPPRRQSPHSRYRSRSRSRSPQYYNDNYYGYYQQHPQSQPPPQQYSSQHVIPPPQQYYDYIPAPSSNSGSVPLPPVKTEPHSDMYGVYQNRR